MQKLLWMFVLAVVCYWGCAPSPEKPPKKAKKHNQPHPLPTKKIAAADVTPADNGRCFGCHLNYKDEEFASTHAVAGVGCGKCHGPSDAHCDDEKYLTAPEIMYPRKKVNPSCFTCHGEILPKGGDDSWSMLAEQVACTVCHGKHRLSVYRRRWDKQTGKVIE
jgi:hypothetical protein